MERRGNVDGRGARRNVDQEWSAMSCTMGGNDIGLTGRGCTSGESDTRWRGRSWTRGREGGMRHAVNGDGMDWRGSPYPVDGGVVERNTP